MPTFTTSLESIRGITQTNNARDGEGEPGSEGGKRVYGRRVLASEVKLP